MNEIIRIGLFLILVFFSNVVQVITGFAGTMLAMPPSIRLIGAGAAKAVLNLLGLAASLCICCRYRKLIVWRQLKRMTGWMLLGMLAGMALFKRLPLEKLLFFYGLLIIGIAVGKLCGKNRRSLPEKYAAGILLTAGIIHGMFVSGGALLVVYAADAIPDKSKFRATVSAVWVVLNAVLLTEHILSGYFGRETIGLSLVSIPFLLLAYAAGNYFHSKIKQSTFLKLTYLLLILSGICAL